MSLRLEGGIAVVGVSCRFPGADGPDALWSLLTTGITVDAPLPDGRWEAGALAGLPEQERRIIRRGAFLGDVAGFDAGFFGMTAREAAMTDPQQRLMLELGWEALEDAGITAQSLSHSRTGVFIGAATDDYSTLTRARGAAGITAHTFTGSLRSLIANRVSYFLKAKGPSLVVDTGQSSSLVAVHLAAESLRRGESDIAIAGGVCLRLTPHHAIAANRIGALSQDGRCHVFDARANGFAQGEGGGAVVLKPLAAALADGDDIYCVIRGSAVTNDGGGEQLTAPTVNGQAEAIRAAYRQARVDPAAVVHVELHGTGTPTGDPVEAAALGAAIGTARTAGNPLRVGSIKSNIGHLEAAAGIAGFLKTALCARAGTLVPTADFHTPNPRIALADMHLRVQTSLEPIPGDAAVYGISSFGVGGTNCHVAVSAPPRQRRGARPRPAEPAPIPIVLSAADPGALRAQASRLAAVLDGTPDLLDAGWSLITTRSRFEHRAVVIASDRTAAGPVRDGLAAIAAGEPATAVVQGLAADTADPVFVFPGQGPQWVGMAAELLGSSAVFAESIAACAEALAPFTDWSLIEVLRGQGPAAALDRVDVVQPALWAVMVALADTWAAMGVRPSAVIGHSQGEIAAATVAGILSRSDGARVVALRSRIIARRLAGEGGMASVSLPAEEVRALLAEHPGIELAALNGPRSTVISGPSGPLDRILALLEGSGVRVRVRRVPVDYASHSAHVDALTDELMDALAPITPRSGTVAFHSTVTGTELDGAELTPEYWCRNLRRTVRFQPTVESLLTRHTVFIEPSPHPVLTVRIQETAEQTGRTVAAIGTLRRDDGTLDRMVTSAAEAWTAGVAVDWTVLFRNTGTRRVPLPTYPFQRTRHWLDTSDAQRPEAASALALRRADGEDLPDILRDMVRRHTAVVLGLSDPGAVADETPFREQGLTSVAGAELCATLARATGVSLPATTVFDYPTPIALAAHLEQRAQGGPIAEAAIATPAVREGDPVVIVGMACRYPGGVCTPEQLWQLLVDGRDAIGAFPADRGWDLDSFGASITSRGGFLYDVPDFDSAFFGISPREALAMDPQQRLLLEISWEAIERAGIDPHSLRGSDTGIFSGVMAQDYGPRLHDPSDGTDGYRLTGSTTSVASGRVAYALGVEGPAITVDTACSSSLVALHLATEAVRRGDCAIALAGGVTVLSSPGIFVEFSRQGGLSADGRCKAFAAAADGTGWGEGAGVLVLERLSDAQRNNHPILAIVRGSAVNQDGASNGLTAPNGPSQQRVIRRALATAGLEPADVDAVEAHGTGTALGDPIEAQALLATYGQDRDEPLWLGSLKSNIGHTQAAAGVAGVIKMVMAIGHGLLPRTLHVDEPTREIDWTAGKVELLREPRRWDDTGRPRRAGVSSFGISGTNAHVVLEQPPADGSPGAVRPQDRAVDAPWLLSALDEVSLAAQARRLHEHLTRDPSPDPADIGYTLAVARSRFGRRAAVLGEDIPARAAALAALADGTAHPGVVRGTAAAAGRTVFVFPGQGSQWPGMGAALLDTSAVFAEWIDRCERALAPFVAWSLTDALRDNDSALDRVDIVQPALWAVMVSLSEVWRSLGVEPDAVIGHSQGEIAAACVAGILTLDDAARIVALRSRLIGRDLAGTGTMASIALSAQDVRESLSEHPGVGVAALNGPRSTVVAGPRDALEAMLSGLEPQGVRVRRIPVDYASHTPDVEGLRAGLAAALAPIAPRTGRISFYSTVTGTRLDGSELTAEYWFRNLRHPVLFHPTTEALIADRYTTFLEPSPHPVLTASIQDTAEAAGTDVVTLGTLRREHGARADLLASAAHAWTRGIGIEWAAEYPDARPITLPTYPFQRTRYWPDTSAGSQEPESGDGEFWSAVQSGDTAAVASLLGLREDRPDWMAEAMPALARRREIRRASERIDALRYAIEWTSSAAIGAGTPAGRWLVVTPDGEHETAWAPAVRDRLRAGGAEVIELRLGAQERGSLADLLPPDVDAVLSLPAANDVAPYGRAVPPGAAAGLTLIHALADAGLDIPLWTITTGAVAVDTADSVRNPAQSQVWGLGRVVALEQPERWGGLIDLPDLPDEPAVRRLTAVLAQRAEDQVAIRDSGTFVRRLVHAPAKTPVAERHRARGVVLITGGTGALGARVARRLARDGAAHLVLAGRRGPLAPGADALAAELRALGAAVDIVACDVGDRTAVARLLARFPVTSIFHAAGMLDDAVVDSLTVDQLGRVLRVKADGARHLHELTAGRDLDEFVLFSSISGVLGIPGQGGYAPGNAYLDALAEHRRARGLPAASYAWGPWAGDGMAAPDAVADRLRRHGVPPLDPDRALEVLLRGADEDRACVMVADIRWDRFHLAYAEARPRPLIAGLPEVRAHAEAMTGGRDDEPGSRLAVRVRALRGPQRSAAVLEAVCAQVAAVLGHAGAPHIDAEKPFHDLGFDSLTGVELRNRLGAETGVRLPSSLVFDHPTAAAAARYIESLLTGAQEPEPVAATAEPGDDDPVVIVAMACRYPGDVRSPEELWRLVVDGGDAIGDFPTDRGWDLRRLRQTPDGPGASVTGRGGFLYDAADFDATLFGISPREALAMDPQQRLLLETAWETFERAGIDPKSLRGSETGVFVGLTYQDYQTRVAEPPRELEGYLLTGVTASVASGRIAYTFGLEGPAVTIDTACSSSLVALHLAAQAVRRGECTAALAGGVALMATPHMFTEFSRQQGLSPDGRCKAFSRDADGFGAAEGVGLLLVERLSRAERLAHPVLAVVRGSAVNQDGASNGLTAPNGPSQQRVIRRALADAGLRPADVDAVETHGTGTRLGDPIEAQALLATYGRDRARPLLLGSVKSNIGHTQAAAGAAGIIKMVMAMRHGLLPRTLHAEHPAPDIDWDAGAIALLTDNLPWPADERPRRAAVSSFGVSGTNAHVILEQPPVAAVPATSAPEPAVTPWVVSAKTPEALRAQAQRLLELGDPHPADVAYSLATTRAALEHRAVVLGRTRDELITGLAAVADGSPAELVVEGSATAAGKVVFVFPGQGSQWPGMGAALLDSSPVFADRIGRCARALEPFVDWSLTDVLRDTDSPLDRVDIVQPALWAVMVSLAETWRSLGVEPAAVIGHSQGEIAAACVAGALSLDDGARIVALRSRIIAERLAGQGGMASIALPVDGVRPHLPTHPGIDIAAVNGPRSTVVAGPEPELDRLLRTMEHNGIRVRRIPVDYASHTAAVESIRTELDAALADVVARESDIAFYSTVTGARLDGGELTPDYWYRNLRRPVLFHPAVEALIADRHTTFIEPSAHPILTAPLEESSEAVTVVGTLRRNEGDLTRLLTSAAQAWAHGLPVDWTSQFPGAHRIPLPTYAFQRARYWMEDRGAGPSNLAAAGQRPVRHPLLSARIDNPDGQGTLFTGRIALDTHPWLADHVIAGVPLLPGTAVLEMAVRAGDEVGCDLVEDLTLTAPLPLPESGGVQLHVRVEPARDGRCGFSVYARPEDAPGDDAWTLHAGGTLTRSKTPAPAAPGTWPPPDATSIPVDSAYERLAANGYSYGPAFRGLRAMWRRGSEIFAEIALPQEQWTSAEQFTLHPGLLDAAAQTVLLAAATGDEMPSVLPFEWRGFAVSAAGATAARVCLRTAGPSEARLSLMDTAGVPIAEAGALVLRPVNPAELARAGLGDGLFRVEWSEFTPPSVVPADLISRADVLDAAELATLATELATAPPALVFARLDRREDEDEPDTPCAEHAQGEALRILELLRTWLAEPVFDESQLVLVTRHAVQAVPDDPIRTRFAAVWGMVRSAQTEHPDRFVLADVDEADASHQILPIVVAGGEPQIAVRRGRPMLPRLIRARVAETAAAPADSEGTVLITGGTGTLGRLVARHLIDHHGVRRVLLISRQGPAAEGAAALLADLRAAGAHADILACDAADRSALTRLFDRLGATHPITAVVHAAGVLGDGTIDSLTPDRVVRVLRPKIAAAVHLHELTRRHDVPRFVLFSSAAGVLGSAGQAGYAAANAYLDALACYRRSHGDPAVSLAWGLWDESSGLTATLTDADVRRLSGLGIGAMATDAALALFDIAWNGGADAAVVPMRMDSAALAAAGGPVPAMLRDMVRVPVRRRAIRPADHALPAPDLRDRTPGGLLELVRTRAAAVLGHDSAQEVPPTRAFRDLGFDSLAAVDLRNRLNTATGLRLAATVVFDHPSPAALAEHIERALSGASHAPAAVAPVTAHTDDPVVIVGMGCRFPGGADSPEALWHLVRDARDAVAAMPSDRGWDPAGMYDPTGATPGSVLCTEGAFLPDAAGFDADLFGISPREALAMDPQQRLLLETAWETFEGAGIDPMSLRGSRTGVFAGVMYHDYGARLTDVPADVEGYLINGSAGSVASGRVAYVFGLEGPAVTVDTACSSSLVAMHLAAQALRNGECTMALAGGVTVMATPAPFVEFSRQRGLAPDGRCKAFAAAADGTGWGEGAGLVLLERLSDARRNNHPVLAVLRGSAVNQDGASNGLTAPNGPAQQRVIRQALADAGLQPSEIDAVEAHGTGTRLGDPIEAQALLAVYGQDRAEPLRLGSVKSNIGHTQAAAGAAGVIKTIMAMRYGILPRTLHVDQPTPHVEWAAGSVELLTENTPWPDHGRPRRAGVSSFGVSGTNAHIILEQAGESDSPPSDRHTPPIVPWVISGRGPAARAAGAARLAAAVRPQDSALDIGWSLATGRAALNDRAVVLTGGGTDRAEALEALARGASHPAVITGRATGTGVAMVFSGQGTQRTGMGHELYDTYPVYAAAFDTVCAELDRHLAQPLRDIVFGADRELLDQTRYAQPALFALQVALYRLWESWGVTPAVVAGHSIGEIAAAHIAGALTLTDAAALVAARGTLMHALPAGGAMVAVDMAENDILPHVRRFPESVAVAAVNGPKSVVLSGDHATLARITGALDGHRITWLRVSHAFHSPLMDAMLDEFGRVVAQLPSTAPTIPMVSTVTGRPIERAELTEPGYWISHARNTVRFADALEVMAELGPAVHLEIGPTAALTAHVTGTAVASLRHDRPEPSALAAALARLVVSGVDPNWRNYFADTGARGTRLPTYPFQHERYWLDNRPAGVVDLGAAGLDSADHPILKASVTLPSSGRMLFTGRVSLASLPWLADHRVHDAVLFPGTAFLDLVLHAGRCSGYPGVAGLTLDVPLALTESDRLQVRVEVGEPGDGRRAVAVYSRPESAAPGEPWTRHCSGVLDAENVSRAAESVHWPPADATALDIGDFYDRMAESGIVYGPVFRGMRAVWRRGDELYAEIRMDGGTGDFAVHPALFDAAVHLTAIEAGGERAHLPFSWTGVTLHGRAGTGLMVRLVRRGDDEVALELADPSGSPVASVSSLAGRPISDAPARVGSLRVDWHPVTLPSATVLPADTTVLNAAAQHADSGDIAESARFTAEYVLGSVQDWFARQTDPRSRLVVVTDGIASDDPARRLPAAAVWGVVRSVQAEHPGRVVLADGDDRLPAAVASGEPQVVLGATEAFVPRLVRRSSPVANSPWRPGTVVMTGAGGALGGRVARHLVERHGVRRLLLVSRRGESSPGSDELAARLRASGAAVEFAACDVSDRPALAGILASVPARWPISAVVHCAGVVDDAALAGQSAERLRTVFGPKAVGAWHLHELTRELNLSAFVLFSSAAGVLGSAGQANYGAANGFLDALAEIRRAQGLPAVSLAWGLWDVEDGMAGELGDTDRRRLARTGVLPIREDHGLAMFDEAMTSRDATIVPLLLDRAALRARGTHLPAVLREVPGAPTHEPSRNGTATLRDRIGGLTGQARRDLLADAIRAEVATTLGHAGPTAVDAQRSFTDLGFDSLTAVELRNRLAALTGIALPATVVFDHPSTDALAGFLDGRLPSATDTLVTELDRVGTQLLAAEWESADHARIADRLEHLLAEWNRRDSANRNGDLAGTTTPEELMDFIDRNL
ncbi:SDR family NAD(P)-dependent oxidoreductase [Nocardia sp. NEAU-G5]|uniref:SDR family NAD(P)-dependent oxidoreductase n=1 Tax=Nocardia albiluteola TaxID=2842303 RepID=A0ABS6BCV1_9NOCA|nr:type I polyketide synthase [Nocardia albiluteola]MBU3068121.1 SDR family NAD(P)-dependent oxidoreductase [Nocardia albiluteola]